MTWRDTLITLALWIGVCLVIFYGNWIVSCGVILIVSSMNWISVDRVNAARMGGFEIGKKSIKPIVISEQVGYKPTFCFANGRVVRVGRDH